MRLSLLALLFCLVGCRSSSAADASLALSASPDWLEGRLPAEAEAPRDGGTLVVRVMSEPGCLNQLADGCRDGWVARMTNRLVTQTLLVASPSESALKPELASEWTESADHTVSHFTPRASAPSTASKSESQSSTWMPV